MKKILMICLFLLVVFSLSAYAFEVKSTAPSDTEKLYAPINVTFLGNATSNESEIIFKNISLFLTNSANASFATSNASLWTAASNITNTAGVVSNISTFVVALGVGNYTFNFEACTINSTSVCNASINRSFEISTDTRLPGVNLSLPINGTNYTSKYKTNFENLAFTGIIAENVEIKNITLLINATRNVTLTNMTDLANGTYSINISLGLSNSTYTWAFESCDISGNCNQSANWTVHTFFDDSTAPVLTANYTNSSVNLGEPLSLYTLWSEASINASNSTCRITLNGVTVNATINATIANSTHAWCNYSFIIGSDYYPNITAIINISDGYNNSVVARFVTDFNLRCADSIKTNFTLYDNLYCSASNGLNISASNIKVDLSTFHINGTAGYDGIAFSNNASNVLLTGGTLRLFSRGLFFNGTANANNISNVFITNNSVGMYSQVNTNSSNKLINVNVSYSTEKGLNLSNVTSTWTISSRNVFVNSNLSYNGTITFENGATLELANSYITLNGTYINTTGNITALLVKFLPAIDVNTSTLFSFDDVDANLTFYLNTTSNGTVLVNARAPGSAPSGYNAVKGLDIVAGFTLYSNMSWMNLVMFYNASELATANVLESSLKIYYYNDSLGAWVVEPSQTLVTNDKYAMANVTHLSLFGLFGTAPTTYTPGGGGGGGSSSDYCYEDWKCGSWSACVGGMQTRTCQDLNGCSSSTSPAVSRTCETPKPVVQPEVTKPVEEPKKTTTPIVPKTTTGKAAEPASDVAEGWEWYAMGAAVVLLVLALIIYFIKRR